MNSAFKAEDITLNAHQWTFEGDCKLLEWMKQITENLESRTNKTTEAFDKLNVDVKRANIALDNAANSLTALQYTQFVESRCHDEDETIANQAEVPIDLVKSDNEQKSSTEVFKTFLENNLKMLHNCHEKYAIDFDDSDDEDSTNNCIYQTKNPYNDRLLPHIFGSKLWKENWHVGLCDGANDYSGDEKSEAFSDSTSSLDDTISYESNNANLSQWASSNSVNDSLSINVPIAKPSLHGPTNLLSEEQRLHIRARQAAGSSESSSSTSRSLSTKPETNEYDLFASLAKTQPSAIPVSITKTTGQEREARVNSDRSQSSSLNSSNNTLPINNTQYNNAKEDNISNATAEKPKITANQIKRKPVNLFDDDDFNSLMTQITDKAQSKTEKNAPIKAAAGELATDIERSLKQRNKDNDNVDLFNSQDKNSINLPSDKKIEKPQEQTRKRLNLFDSPDISPTTESVFPPTNIEETSEKLKTTKTKITAKSLFDDDDEEDDFLNVFGTKKPSKDLHAKTLLFVDDPKEENDIFVSKGNTKENKKDLFERKKIEHKVTEKSKSNKLDLFGENDNDEFEISISKKTTLTKKSNLFEDDDDINNSINDPFQKTNEKKSKLFVDESVADAKTKATHVTKEMENFNTLKKSLPTKPVDIFAEPNENNSKLTQSERHPNLFSKESIDSGRSEPKIINKATIDLFADVEQNKIIPTDVLNIRSDVEGHAAVENKTKNLFKIEKDKVNPEIHKSNSKDILINKESSVVQNEERKQTISNSKKLLTDLFQSNIEDDDLFLKKPNRSEDTTENNAQVITSKPTTAYSITNDSDNINEKIANVNKKVVDDLLAPVVIKNNEELTTNDSINKLTTQYQIDEPSLVNNRNNKKVETENAPTESTETISQPVLKNNDPSSIITDDIYEEENLPQNNLKDDSTMLPNAANNYASIFLDEPPDDDDFFQSISTSNKTNITNSLDLEHDFYEPPLPQTPATTINTPQEKSDSIKRSNDYSSLHLFSDIPPDDDGIADIPNSTETKRLHSIFYDDFLETQTAIRNPTSVPTHSLFDDEPPPDVDIFNTLEKLEARKETTKISTDVTDHQGNDKREEIKISATTSIDKKINSKSEAIPVTNKQKANTEIESKTSVITTKNIIDDKLNNKKQIKTDISNKETSKQLNIQGKSDSQSIEKVQSTDKSQENVVSKLKLPKININVQALLPNAGGKPNFKKVVNEEPITTPSAKTEKKETILETSNQSPNSGSEKILSSLVKDRVRIPVKRKPSTRKARQENYLKSVLNEKEREVTGEDDLNPTNKIKQNTIKIQSTNTNQMKDSTDMTNSIKANEQTNEVFIEPHREEVLDTPTGAIGKTIKQNSNLVATEFQQKFQSKLRTVDIFHDDNDDDNDDFLFKPTDKAKQQNSSKETTKTQILYHTEQNNSTKSNKSTATSMESNQDDDLLKLPTKMSTHTVNNATTTHSLFAQSDDLSSDDDLFDSPKQNTTKPLPSAKVLNTKVDSTPSSQTSKSLFGEEETYSSDENLFKSTNESTQKSVAKESEKEIKQKKSLLFESDDEDDDDFLTAIKKKDGIKTKPISLNQDKGKNLFSDIESDDDDLFNAKPNKNIAAKPITTNPAVKQITRQPQLAGTNTSKTKTTSPADDPLADLLNS